VTSLKDGMNLVAKEFCAAQVDELGVVVISEFAGASAELQHGALVVNPNDLAGIAEAVYKACVMPVEEKRSRMRLLRDIVRTYSVQNWAEAFLTAALDARSQTAETRQSIPLATPETREQKIA
jgi:trehalose 6-phosphate synthase/phosphatase